MSIAEELRSLIERHCATVAGEAGLLSESVAAIFEGGSDGALASSIAHAHKIVGSSGSIGFPEVSAAAADLERALKALSSAPPPERRATIAPLMERLNKAVHAITPEQSRLYSLKL